MAVKVDIKDFPKVFKKYGKGLNNQFQLIVVEALIHAIPDLVQNSPVDTGHYASSWDIDFEKGKYASLGNHAPHAPIIEFGARPFTPPLPPLLAWAKRVLKDPSQPPNYSSEVWALAKGTQKKIAEVGMQPKHILTNEIPKIIQNIEKRVKGMELDPAKVKRPTDE